MRMSFSAHDVARQPSRPRFLLISDLDGTLIPPEWGDELKAMRHRFVRLVEERADLVLAYATGRNYRLAIEGIREHDLPSPDSLVCEVGSAVYYRRDQAFEDDTEYTELMESGFGSDVSIKIRKLLESVVSIHLQEPIKQGRFKVSFYADLGVAGEDVVIEVQQALGRIDDQVNVVFSVDPLDGRGLLDIIPAGVSKASASHYLRTRFALAAEQVLYAGDSGNDTAALLAGFNAILVGNAPESLRVHLRKEFQRRRIGDRLHCSESCYVSGVLEGCARFGLS